MKIFLTEQIKEIDDFTIKHEPVASIDLMERAAGQVFKWITERYGRSDRFVVFAGPGNNGGDGLALARMLAAERYDIEVHYVNFTDKTSPDWGKNRKRLEAEAKIRL
ncbi:MAG: bifunctional ADP-dependent NAD(P)H-hydrate dehydratase/NAD(P)H-hydrate epimerase, partial [Bacteroidetes bacterium]